MRRTYLWGIMVDGEINGRGAAFDNFKEILRVTTTHSHLSKDYEFTGKTHPCANTHTQIKWSSEDLCDSELIACCHLSLGTDTDPFSGFLTIISEELYLLHTIMWNYKQVKALVQKRAGFPIECKWKVCCMRLITAIKIIERTHLTTCRELDEKEMAS